MFVYFLIQTGVLECLHMNEYDMISTLKNSQYKILKDESDQDICVWQDDKISMI